MKYYIAMILQSCICKCVGRTGQVIGVLFLHKNVYANSVFLSTSVQRSKEQARLAEAESQRLQRESAITQELEQKYMVFCL